MSLTDHLESLRAKHTVLDEAISAEYHRPSPDSVAITRLKRQKLRLKEQIAGFSEDDSGSRH
ncbi:MAG: YdcH family protein [Pseudomonadota bacterium]